MTLDYSHNSLPTDFIELNRTFHELADNFGDAENIEDTSTFQVGKKLHWSDLITEYRVIILAEAGAGKTREIRNITKILQDQGKPAFFLRLESITTNFEMAFEIGSLKNFEEWESSNLEGWILLDSIDEARLKDPKDFENAIRKINNLIKTAKERAHIIITSRPNAWRSKTDLNLCNSQLPHSAITKSIYKSPKEDDEIPDFIETRHVARPKNQTGFKIVKIDDLSYDQIKTFVMARDIEAFNSFLDEVDRANARSFTTRPQDLEELVEIWKEKRSIGSHLDFIKNSIKRRLAERDQSRAETQLLSAEKVLFGAKIVAAAATLSKNPTIRIPDGTENTHGIPIKEVLPDWDEKEHGTLLSRPIFDEAIYGTVRFHHRSIQEYLTAEWFSFLLKKATSRRDIELLFFKNLYGFEVVPSTLQPVLPWLAILDENILEKTCRKAPGILLEGGDPSLLPVTIRKRILTNVCEQIAGNVHDYPTIDYAALRYFAKPDIAEDVCTLIKKYADNETILTLLLRMAWHGKLTPVLPEAFEIALCPFSEKHLRIAAFKVIKAIGIDHDRKRIRTNFLNESNALHWAFIAELAEDLNQNEENLEWLIACLEKSAPQDYYSADHLSNVVTEFVNGSNISLLPRLAADFNRLLSTPPRIEYDNCRISEKNRWLLNPAKKVIERLILTRNAAAIDNTALSILYMISTLYDYGGDFPIEKAEVFLKIVPEWNELNRALFWFEVKSARENNRFERGLNNFWQVSAFGSFWRFDKGDFDYVIEIIKGNTLNDDKMLALSIAFSLYKSAVRPRSWRLRLKKAVEGNELLTRQLNTLLNPPALDDRLLKIKRKNVQWKKRIEFSRAKDEKYHTKWRKRFVVDLDSIQKKQSETPGEITTPIYYLYQRLQYKPTQSNRWTEYAWQTLTPEYGETVARFYRNTAVTFWRNYTPVLHSEGAPFNQTPVNVIFGLTGLEIEAMETSDWAKTLTTSDVELACRYASFELNGFPTWFPKLFEAHSNIVADFLMQEIRYELAIEKSDSDTYYLLSDVASSGQWAWDNIAPDVYEMLAGDEPKNLSNLDNLLTILQGSTMAGSEIATFAEEKCQKLKSFDHVGRWYAVWTGINPDQAIPSFIARINELLISMDRTNFAMIYLTQLIGGSWWKGAAVRNAFNSPTHLETLYLLMHEQIRVDDDISHNSVYSPALRDHAQDARETILRILQDIPGKEAYMALKNIAEKHPEESFKKWISHHTKLKAVREGDIEPWQPTGVREFNNVIERMPQNQKELFDLAVLRLLDLKDDLENGDSSIAETFQKISEEIVMRKFIGRELREKAFRRYTITQEEEFADAKKPDLRFHGVNFDGPVPVELKLADNWTGPVLYERLRNQLCGDYLRDNRSNRGIFVLVYRGKKTGWKIPGSNKSNFMELTSALQEHWQQISPKFPKIDDIAIIGIDLTKRLS